MFKKGDLIMNMSDIIALAKAGYKKKDIDDLLKVELPDSEPAPAPDLIPDDGQDIENGQRDGAEDDPEQPDPDFNVEIKTEMEKQKQEIADLRQKLAAAQKMNVNKSVDDHRDLTAERNTRIANYARDHM